MARYTSGCNDAYVAMGGPGEAILYDRLGKELKFQSRWSAKGWETC